MSGAGAAEIEVLTASLKAEAHKHRAFAARLIQRYRLSCEPDDLIQSACAEALTQGRRIPGHVSVGAVTTNRIREVAWKLRRHERAQVRIEQEHARDRLVGVVYPMPRMRTRAGNLSSRPRMLNGSLAVGPRLVPELGEIVVSPAWVAFIRRARSVLSERACIILTASYIAGYSHVEIARRAGVRPGSVREMLAYIVAKLRQHPEVAEPLQEA